MHQLKLNDYFMNIISRVNNNIRERERFFFFFFFFFNYRTLDIEINY